MAGGDAIDDRQPALALAIQIGGAHRIAVDGGIIERRHIDRSNDILREHAAGRLPQRHRLAAADRRNTLGDQALRIGDRHERAGEGETVVAELRHQAFPSGRPDLVARQRLGLQHVGDAFNVVEHQHRHCRLRQRRIGRDGDDAIVIGMQQRLAHGGAKNLELGMGVALEPLHHHQIDRAELRQNIRKRRLGLLAQLMDDCPAPARHDRDLAGAGLPVLPRILARLIDVEFMVRVLDGRDLQAAADQHRNHARDQRRLAGTAPARETDDAHRAPSFAGTPSAGEPESIFAVLT